MLYSKGKYRRSNLKQWCNFLNTKPRDNVVVDYALKDALARIGYYPEFNPASFFKVEQMWDALKEYGSGFNADLDYFMKRDEFSKAIKVAFKVFGSNGTKLTPLTTEQELYNSIQKDTSAGLPSLKSKEESFPTSYMRFLDIKKGKKAFNPCLAQFRTQRKKVNGIPVGKTRNIFAYPLDATIFESQYFYPLQRVILKKRTPYAGGLWRCELGSRLSSTLNRKYIYEFDYSRYDATIPLGLIRVAFNIIKTWYSDEHCKDINKIMQYFVHTPIVMPDGNLYVGKEKGIPSGSNFTQIVGSIINFILTMAVSFKFNLRVNWYCAHFVGDDGIFTSDKKVNLESIALWLNKFGLVMNPAKSRLIDSSENPHFVGFSFIDGVPTKNVNEVVSSLCYPERPRKYDSNPEEHANMLMRQIGLLSLQAVDILRKRMSLYNDARFIEFFKHDSRIEGGSDFLTYRNKYILKDKEYINFLSTDYLK